MDRICPNCGRLFGDQAIKIWIINTHQSVADNALQYVDRATIVHCCKRVVSSALLENDRRCKECAVSLDANFTAVVK